MVKSSQKLIYLLTLSLLPILDPHAKNSLEIEFHCNAHEPNNKEETDKCNIWVPLLGQLLFKCQVEPLAMC